MLIYCFINLAEDQSNPINEFYAAFVLEKRMTPAPPSLNISEHAACFSNLLNWIFCLQF
jgi:hypothetical protein